MKLGNSGEGIEPKSRTKGEGFNHWPDGPRWGRRLPKTTALREEGERGGGADRTGPWDSLQKPRSGDEKKNDETG